jgi:hypothetical protein
MTWEVNMKLKKLLIGLVAFLMFASPSFAQSFGVRLGFPIGVQYSSANPGLQGTGFRVALETSFFLDVNLQADLMLGQIELSKGTPLTLFYGAGLHAGFIFLGWFDVGAQGTIGLEYLLQPGISLFVDASLGLSFNFGTLVGVGLISPYFGGAFGVSFKL